MENKLKTHELKRELPSWAKVVKNINGVDIYNMSVFDNVLSWTKTIPDVPAIDYFGNIITFGELPDKVREYVNGLNAIGIANDDVITVCMPVLTESNLLLYAVNHMGRIQNNPNFLFLKNNFKKYTADKGSKTLIILDAYLSEVIDYIEPCGIKNVVITNLNDYLPEDKKDMFSDMSSYPKKIRETYCDYEKQLECAKKVSKMHNVNFIKMQEVIDVGVKSKEPLKTGPVDIERDVSYSYTSGTTGDPKCIVFKEQSSNAMIELHKGINTKDYVGDRCFQIIPLTHSTGERFGGYVQMARGKTMVPQPIYNKEAFGKELMKSKCNWVVAAPSFYISGIAQGLIAPDAFKNLNKACSGGEPITKSNIILIDKWLQMNGYKGRLANGGGAAEDGSSTLTSYFLDDATKTNETGKPLPGVIVKIVDENGKKVQKGERGYMEVSTPAGADRYLDDPEASNRRWYIDEEGYKWGRTEDITVQNPDGSYNVLGRSSDSCLDNNGNTIYLFDIEYSLDVNDPIIEWEITAHKDINGKNYIVGQVVPKNEYIGREDEIIEYLCQKYNLSAVKIYEKFESSEVTGKRDYKLLQNDKLNYYAPYDEKNFLKIDFNEESLPIIKIVNKDECKNVIINNIDSKKLVKKR